MIDDTVHWHVTVRNKDTGDAVSFTVSAQKCATERQLQAEARKILDVFADRQRARDDVVVHIMDVLVRRRQKYASENVDDFLRFLSAHIGILAAVSEFVKRNDPEACVYEFVLHTGREAQEKHDATQNLTRDDL